MAHILPNVRIRHEPERNLTLDDSADSAQTKSMNAQTPIDKAAEIAGGTVALSKALGVAHYNVSKWRRSGVPAKYVMGVERATGVSRHDLRPDIFGPSPSEAA